jgi:hypothetical protein
MGKTNWSRVFLGGLLAGVVFFILGWAAYAVYLARLWGSALEALGRPPSAMTFGAYVSTIVSALVLGILAVWLYSAIRPRYGAGARTAACAGLAFWALLSLFPSLSLASMGLFSANLLVIDCLSSLVIYIVGTLAGAWIYREEQSR